MQTRNESAASDERKNASANEHACRPHLSVWIYGSEHEMQSRQRSGTAPKAFRVACIALLAISISVPITRLDFPPDHASGQIVRSDTSLDRQRRQSLQHGAAPPLRPDPSREN